MNLIIENKHGDTLQLTNNPNYAVTDISGLNPAPANINTSKLATSDGSILNSSSINQRNIVITIYIMQAIETNRIALYRFFRPKQYVKLYYSNDTRDVYIEGYVETFDGTLFTNSEKFQISIICPSPFFNSTTEIESILSNVQSSSSFPFSISNSGVEFSSLSEVNAGQIVNSGDVESGMIIDFYASADVVNPKIYNLDTSEFFGLNYTIEAGNTVRINTKRGQKSVTLITYGVERNLINYIAENSTWLQLDTDTNNFTVTVDSGEYNLTTTIYHTDLYEGV